MDTEQRKQNRKAKMKRIAEHFGHVLRPGDARRDKTRRLWAFGMAESFDPNEPIWPDYERDWEAWTLLVEQFPDGHLDDKTGTFFRFKLECIRGDEWIAGFGTDTMKYAAGGSSIREVFINLAHKIAELDIDVKPPFWEES